MEKVKLDEAVKKMLANKDTMLVRWHKTRLGLDKNGKEIDVDIVYETTVENFLSIQRHLHKGAHPTPNSDDETLLTEFILHEVAEPESEN